MIVDEDLDYLPLDRKWKAGVARAICLERLMLGGQILG
jgi:hypothetical protein